MVFQSLDYALFLIVALIGYWGLARTGVLRVAVLGLFSCLFYATTHPAYLLLILTPTVIDYRVGLGMQAASERAKRWLVGLSVAANLGLLFAFKYFDWTSRIVDQLREQWGAAPWQVTLDVALPAGISFYTFEAISYTVDIYRGTLKPERSFWRFLTFITFFPKLVAGPIVRGGELLPQLNAPAALSRDRVSSGLFLLCTGLVKKVVIADYLSLNLADRVFQNPEGYTSAEIVLGLYAFTMQMYCDFSGYTDLARGSALFFGIELPENFSRPYAATNPAEFWRRWHMTLSTWLRDYLYYPLGGSRGGPARSYFNLWFTFFVIGLWHGASATFALYGCLHGCAMVLHRLWSRTFGTQTERPHAWASNAWRIFLMLQLTVFSRILFRADDLPHARQMLTELGHGGWSTAQLTPALWLILVGSFAAHYTPTRWMDALRAFFVTRPLALQVTMVAAVIAGAKWVAASDVVPYIYFQF